VIGTAPDTGMRVAVAVGGFGLDARWTQARNSHGQVLLQVLLRLSRRPSESLETLLARGVERAFAEFAREMEGW
jgi:hypothetical protein